MILRANPVAFGGWGLSLVTSQLYDSNQAVILEATSLLDEALEDRVCLTLIRTILSLFLLLFSQRLVNIFYKQWPTFALIKPRSAYLSNVCHLAASRLCSIPFHQTQHDEKHMIMMREELIYWDTVFNSQYVYFIETNLFSAYSGGPLLSDDYFERRKTTSTTNRMRKKKIFVHVPPHIYRQLSLHDEGFLFLRSESRLERYATELKQHRTNCININEVQAIKETLWALAHTASTEYGCRWFMEKDLLPDFLRFAEECQNLSVRG